MGYRLFLTMHHFRYDLDAAFCKLDLLFTITNEIDFFLHISLIFL